jgi:two-component system KDP operon response regulator KdpE
MVAMMNQSKQLLLIEDDVSFAAVMADMLSQEQYEVRMAHTGETGLNLFERHPPDIVLLDLNLPDATGFEILSVIRRESNVPVLIISADGRDLDKVRALEDGADDYVTKPFHQEELVARIAALLRRVNWAPQKEMIIDVGDLQVDMARHQVTLRGQPVHLTPIEYAILCILMQRTGEIVTHEELLNAVWGPGYEGDYSVLRVNISRLRQKVESLPRCPNYIITVPRRGYRIPKA